MNEEELKKLDEIIDRWSIPQVGDGGGGWIILEYNPFELREQLIEFINEIAKDIISLSHPVIKEYGRVDNHPKEQEDE
tara:strand:+ start:12 stop:245 length:234 start_codon:yes stop_codon:yes gene_type:complete